MFPHGITVTVVRPSGQDQWGDSLPAAEHTIDGCAVYPRSSTELMDSRDTVISGHVLLAPTGSDIKATDRIRLPDGTEYEVDGRPESWRSPLSGWQPGMAIALQEVTG